jgi:hypothetical protein
MDALYVDAASVRLERVVTPARTHAEAVHPPDVYSMSDVLAREGFDVIEHVSDVCPVVSAVTETAQFSAPAAHATGTPSDAPHVVERVVLARVPALHIARLRTYPDTASNGNTVSM